MDVEQQANLEDLATPPQPSAREPQHLAEGMSPGMRRFVETMGRYFEQYGLARTGGRILGLLMVAERPLSLDDIAARLHVSRASVSTNIRVSTASELVELVTYPGDRRDYYRMIDDAWGHAVRAEIKGILALRRIVERGLEVIASGDLAAREHLDETMEFCDFVLEERQHLLQEWQKRREAKRAPRSRDGGARDGGARDEGARDVSVEAAEGGVHP